MAINVETQRGNGFIKQTIPGAAPRDTLFMKELFDAIFQLIGLFAPHIFNPWAIMRERCCVQRFFQKRVINAVQLQREEEQV